jgi:hypothetical protein
VHGPSEGEQRLVVGGVDRRRERGDPRRGPRRVALGLVRPQGGRVLQDEGAHQVGPTYGGGERDRSAERVPEHHRWLRELREDLHGVLDHHVTGMTGELLGGEAG